MINTLKRIALAVGFLGCFTALAQSAPDIKTLEHKGEIPAGLTRLGDGVLFPQYALVVDKSLKKIHVIDNSSGVPTLVESFDSDLGKKGGDKHSTGDNRTPE